MLRNAMGHSIPLIIVKIEIYSIYITIYYFLFLNKVKCIHKQHYANRICIYWGTSEFFRH
jgi:hypothetical protein